MVMDLSDLDLARPGRRAKAPAVAEVRSLTPDDLSALREDRATSAPPLMGRLRHRHHQLAIAIANGLKDWEAALKVGYDPSRVSILKASPMFQDLIAHYQNVRDAEYAELHSRLADLSQTAAEILTERLEEDPDNFTIGQLHDTVKLGADRTGYGPQSSSTQVHVNINTAARLEAARRRVSDHRKTLELTANPPAADSPDPT